MAMLKPISATPQVTADFTTASANTGCGSLVVEFIDLSTGVPSAWLWDFGNGNTSNLKNPTAIYTSPGLYNVSLRVEDAISNNTKTVNGFIKVNENPTSELQILGLTTGCAPMSIDFIDVSTASAPIVSWQWDFGDGGSSLTQHSSYQYFSDGIFSVSLSIVDANGCQDIVTEINIVHVDQMPVASFDADITFSCNPTETIAFNNTSSGSASYLWDFGDGTTSILSNPTHVFSSGTYTVTLCAKTGICIDTVVMPDLIEVGALLTPNFTTNVNNGCENLLINFNDITNNNPDTWFWDFGDGNTSTQQNPSNNYLNPGVYDITLTTSISGQCTRTLTYPSRIEVLPKPNIDFDIDTAYGCTVPFTVQFTDNTTNAIHWNWHFSNGVTMHGVDPIVTFANYGLYDLSLTIVNSHGCAINKAIDSLINIEEISIDISSDVATGCMPLDVVFNDNTNSVKPIVDWMWDFGDGTSSNVKDPSNQYSSSGAFDVSLEVVNVDGCVSSFTFNNYIIVDELPVINFNASQVISCAGYDIDFIDLSSSLGTINEWDWSFGDGSVSSIQNPTYQYSLTGTYDVSLVAGVNDCRDSLVLTDYIEIIEPTAIFNESYNCDNPLSVDFTNESIGADNVFWDFGDGTTSTALNPTHLFPARGVYNVILSVSNTLTGCTHDFMKVITITIPVTNFDYLINSNYSYEDSVGCQPHQVFLNNLSQDCDYYKVIWSDGSVEHGRIDHIFLTSGLFDVSMIITDIHGCKDTMSRNKMYHIKDVDADFGVINTLGCDSMLVNFEDLTIPSSTVSWDFGDGGTSNINNPQYIYYDEGFYDVALFVESTDGCKDTLERVEYIQFQYPSADFSSNIQGICPRDKVQFNNMSSGIGLVSDWDFGDGLQSNIFSPLHEFSSNGLYDISLTVIDSFGCENSEILYNYIEVLQPSADFITTGLSSNCPPLISNFSNQSSSDVTSWYWSFGDGGVTNLSNPTHLFIESGNFDVSLIVSNHYGCQDTMIRNDLINISGPTGEFSISDTLVCQDASVSFFPAVYNTDVYFWDFGDGNFSQDSFPIHSFQDSGIFTPSLVIENNSGCQQILNSTNNIKVRSVRVDAGIDVEICEGGDVQLNASGNLSLFSWIPIIGLDNPNISNPIASPINDVIYIVQHFDGMCTAVDTLVVNVHNEVPNSSFSTTNNCQNDTVQFLANSGLITGNIAWNWSFGSNLQNPQSQFPVGNNSITLIVENLDNNCKDTLIQNVEVYPLPVANFIANDVCFGEDVYFLNNSSSNVVYWTYSMDDGIGVSYDENPIYLYQNTGLFNPTLSVVSDYGCESDFLGVVKVNENPSANFTVENNCFGEENIFTDQSSISEGSIDIYNFDLGDGTFFSNDTVYHQYNQSGEYTVVLTVISNEGCKSEINKETEVYENPIIDFISEQFCIGNPTNFTDFSHVIDGEIIEWKWDFGDGIGNSSISHPTYTFNTIGAYQVGVTVTSSRGCTQTGEKSITIFDLPSVDFIAESFVCLGDEISFTDLSEISGASIVSWLWNLGDGTIDNNQHPNHRYNYVNVFDISLLVTSSEGCKNDTLIPAMIEVFDLPVADFEANTFFTSELNSEIEFYNTSDGASEYLWDFDNGVISTESDPVFNFEHIRNYHVQLSVLNDVGCESNIIKIIHIYPEYTIFVPNAFSPNGDGDNDVFQTKGNGITEFEMLIYDRWGGIVFETNSIEYGWNGLDARDMEVNNGTYLYHIKVYDYNGKLWVYNGELNLFR